MLSCRHLLATSNSRPAKLHTGARYLTRGFAATGGKVKLHFSR